MEHVLGTALAILRDSARLVVGDADWMAWNLVLALIPLWLASRLFRRPTAAAVGRPAWWLGVGAFFAFLPNAPYVLTDLIHLDASLSLASTHWRAAFVVVPQYLVFCGVGFLAYVT